MHKEKSEAEQTKLKQKISLISEEVDSLKKKEKDLESKMKETNEKLEAGAKHLERLQILKMSVSNFVEQLAKRSLL